MDKRIYTCATAHLDTVWNWDLEHSVSVCLFNTLEKNFKLFEQYPDYKFNFEGSYRYELFEEYYPEMFEKLKEYVQQGRWNVSGSAYENGDVNIPSPEALFRNILYGNSYFDRTFSKRSKDIYLPDCFGFGYALPSIIRHANLMGFTTQKLTWGSAYGTPFDIGKWYGVDGNFCYACVKPDAYVLTYKCIREKKDNVEKLKENIEKYGLPWTFSFHGDGDQGGAPNEKSVKVLEREISENNTNEIKVISARSDEIYDDLDALSDAEKDRLPSWNNELVMREHAVGGYTSRAIGKRWNRRCEELADMTERCAVFGSYLGCMTYPEAELEKAWKRVISHQFHDDLPGTSIQKAYQRSWNDYVLSLNQLENEYEHSLGAVVSLMDTSWVEGTAVVVNNSIEHQRKSLVKAFVPFSKIRNLAVYNSNNELVPAQIISRNGNNAEIAFIADVESLGYAVFDVRESDANPYTSTSLFATENTLENERYIVTVDDNGDISQIYDKKYNKELLKEPVRHQIIDYFGSKHWPAWEMTYESVSAEPIGYPKLKSIRLIYDGPAVIAFEIVQTYEKSTFKKIISLSVGGECVEVENEIDWWQLKTLLKDSFSFNCSNDNATFDLGLGAIKRGNATKKLFEVPAQKWADISENGFGVSVLSDSKYGWDKRDNNTLRMTVVHTPRKNFLRDSMQSLMEIGLNRYSYAIHSHADKLCSTQTLAREFSQPLSAVITDKHNGKLKKELSFGTINRDNIILRALKKAENNNKIIVRFNEGNNEKTDNISFTLGNGIEKAEEVYASEEYIADATVIDGSLVFNLEPYGIKTFALTLKGCNSKSSQIEQKPLNIKGNTIAFTKNTAGERQVINDFQSTFIPCELNKGSIRYKGVDYLLDKEKAISCEGQKLYVDDGYNRLSVLAFSLSGDKQAEFRINNKPVRRTVLSATDIIGQWDMAGLSQTAKIKNCNLAYEFTHSHNERGADIIAKQMFVFQYDFDVENTDYVELPSDSDIIILAATLIKDKCVSSLAYPMYDRVEQRDYEPKYNSTDCRLIFTGKLPHNAPKSAPKKKRVDKYKLK